MDRPCESSKSDTCPSKQSWPVFFLSPQHWLGNGAHLWLLPPSSALVTHHAPWTIPLLSHIRSHSHLNSGNPGCSSSLSTWIFAGVTHPDPWFSLWATWGQVTGYPHNQQWLLLTEPFRSEELYYNMVHTILLLETKHNTVNMHVRV